MNRNITYSPSFFKDLKNAEKNHFWFVTRRKWIFEKIRKFSPPPAILLEVGCGTGNVSSYLAKKGYQVTGCEYYQEAISTAWPGFHIIQGDAQNLPFADSSFDIVGIFDVIEHFQDDTALIREATRVVRKGGIIAVSVPAREELWSFVDEASYHKRRYEKENLERIFSDSLLTPLSIEYIFMSLYVPMKFTRRAGRKNDNMFAINKVVNGMMKGLFTLERIFSRGFPLPIGTSLIAVAQKN